MQHSPAKSPSRAGVERASPTGGPSRWPRCLAAGGALVAAFAAGWWTRVDFPAAKPVAAAPKVAPGKLTKAVEALNGTGLPQGVGWDPSSPLADILRKLTGGDRIAALAKLVAETPTGGLGHLPDLAAICPDKEMRQMLQDLVYAKWVAADPKGALAYANTVAGRADNPAALNSVFAAWAGLDPAAAFAAAQQLGTRAFRDAEQLLVMATWAQGGDPTGALDAMRKLQNGQVGGPNSRALYDAWSKVDPQGAWAALDQIDYAAARNAVKNMILSNMASSDPAGAFKLLAVSPEGGANSGGTNPYTQIFQKWAQTDPAAALAALGQIPVGPNLTQSAQSLFQSWAQTDPAAALQAAQALPGGAAQTAALAQSLNGLAAQNPQAAADFIGAEPAGNDRDSLVQSLATTWANSNPAAALAWLNQNDAGSAAYAKALAPVLTQLAKQDPDSAVSFIEQMPADASRDNLLKSTMGSWGGTDASAALAWAQSNLSGADQATALLGVEGAMVQANPAGAAGVLGQLPESADRDTAIAQLAGSWAAADPTMAAQWLQNLPADLPAAQRTTAYQSLVDAWTDNDAAGAAAFVQGLAGDPSMGPVINAVAKTLAQADVNTGVAWAESLPPGPAQDGAIATAIKYWAATNPEQAWAYATALPPSDDTTKMLHSIVGYFGRSDPQVAANLLSTIPPSASVPDSAAGPLAAGWAMYDVPAALQWASSLPQGADRDAAVNTIYGTLMKANEPATALGLALSMTDSKYQTNVLNGVFQSWYKSNPAAAADALENAPLTPAQRTQIKGKAGIK